MTSKKITFFLILVLVLLSSSYLIKTILEPKVEINDYKVNKRIDKFDYSLDDRDSELMVQEFNELAIVLKDSSINYEKYASLLAKLYIIDLYTIDNKINANDTPCLEYVDPSIKENFKLNVQNTIYKYVIDNTNNSRHQQLPVVDQVNVDEIVSESFKLNQEEYEGYKVSLSWSYTEDLEYDTKAIINIIKKDTKLFIVKHSN